jgi:glucan phosphorylase
VKDQVVDQARSSFRQARDRAASSLTESRVQAADQIGRMATAFRRTSEHLRQENQRHAADFTESLAEQVERASSYLRERDLGAIRQDLEGLARRQPAVMLGVGFALGLLGARFFKSSERHTAGRL